MRAHRLSALALVVLLAPAAGRAGVPGNAAPGTGPALEAALETALARAAPGDLVPVVAVLRERPAPDDLRFAAQDRDPVARRTAVRDLLRSVARTAQAPLLSRLNVALRSGEALSVRPLWIANAVAVAATPAVVREIAARPEVARVHYDPRRPVAWRGTAPDGRDTPDARAPAPARSPGTDAPIDWGVQTMRAPEVWSTYNDRGEGVLVAVIDVGTCWNHPDLANRIWVNPGEDLDHDHVVMDAGDVNGIDDDGNGYIDDLIGWDFGGNDRDPAPTSSDDEHGTHTAGTIVGDGTSGEQTGMAPRATLMPIRLMLDNAADEADSWLALQYATENGADIISMSYGWYHADAPDRGTWRDVMDSIVAMGTIVIGAAGNAGSSNPPDDVGTPPDVPAVIAVGATDSAEQIASFSSQGPTSWAGVAPYDDFPYPPGLGKPNISAPGVSTRSLAKCTGYTTLSGTSMAAPHVAGAAALVLARKRMSRDEMLHLFETTAVDLGPPGFDRAFGAGRVDAMAAVSGISGWVNYRAHQVVDGGADRGNGDGAADPNELVTLVLTLENSMPSGIVHGVSAVVSSSTPGVTVHDGVAFFPDIPAGTTAVSLAPHVTFTAPAACGGYATFEITTRWDGGQTAQTSFLVRIGTDQETTIFADDFETDRGWTRSGTSTSGRFVRQDPHEARHTDNSVTQPENDHSAGGSVCWVTGNKFPITLASEDDVDGGTEMLTSPRLDFTGYRTGLIELWHWCYLTGQGLLNFDTCRIDVSNDDGATWTTLETYATPGHRVWTLSQFSLNVLPTTNRMRLRFALDDPGPDSIVDGLLDDVKITGTRAVCEGFTPAAVRAPNPVGNTLLVTREAGDVRLAWTVPVTDALHDAPTLYRVTQAAALPGTFDEAGSATVPWHVRAGEAGSGATRFWLVRAENAGGTE